MDEKEYTFKMKKGDIEIELSSTDENFIQEQVLLEEQIQSQRSKDSNRLRGRIKNKIPKIKGVFQGLNNSIKEMGPVYNNVFYFNFLHFCNDFLPEK